MLASGHRQQRKCVQCTCAYIYGPPPPGRKSRPPLCLFRSVSAGQLWMAVCGSCHGRLRLAAGSSGLCNPCFLAARIQKLVSTRVPAHSGDRLFHYLRGVVDHIEGACERFSKPIEPRALSLRTGLRSLGELPTVHQQHRGLIPFAVESITVDETQVLDQRQSR